jgi:hypothetical protein
MYGIFDAQAPAPPYVGLIHNGKRNSHCTLACLPLLLSLFSLSAWSLSYNLVFPMAHFMCLAHVVVVGRAHHNHLGVPTPLAF